MANLCDPTTLEETERFADLINEAKAMQDKELMPDDVECMLFVDEDEDDPGTYECFYYFAHPQKRILFWMNKFDAGRFMIDIQGVNDPRHISKRLPTSREREFRRLIAGYVFRICPGTPLLV